MNRVLEAIAEERSDLMTRLRALDEMERVGRTFGERIMSTAEAEKAIADERPTYARPQPSPRSAVAEPARALPPVRRTQPQLGRRPSSEVAERRARLRGLIKDLEPVQFDVLRERTGTARDVLQKDLQKLRVDGVVQSDGRGNLSCWHLTETRDRETAAKHGKHARPVGSNHRCCDDILSTVRSAPNVWTEQRIVSESSWDREQVADACGRLLDEGQVVLNPNGTYGPAHAEILRRTGPVETALNGGGER